MTVGQIMEEPLLIHGIKGRDTRMELVHLALEGVKLSPGSETASKFPYMLSVGQRQRVNIARAMVLEPELVVADEPVSMVDTSSRAEILYILKKIQEQQGTAFVYITHDIATAYYCSDRITVMYLGHIVETGPTKEVISTPLHPYTRALISAAPESDPGSRFKKLSTGRRDLPSPTHPPSGCHFHPRCTYAFDRCAVCTPKLQEIYPRHFVSCHIWA